MDKPPLEQDSRSPSQIAAAETRRRVLSLERRPVSPDPAVSRSGKVMPRPAYDSGLAPPPRVVDAAALTLESLDVTRVLVGIEALLGDLLGTATKTQRSRRRSSEAILRWLAQFPGDTWEERWLLSGLDAAPRTWTRVVHAETGVSPKNLSLGLNALLLGRVVRPSYAWLLAAPQYNRRPALFLQINEPTATERLRSLPLYRAATELAQRSAETCISRVLIRTGKRIEQLRGTDLLDYADVTRTSTRKHREHLAWEVLVALGPLAGEPPTLRAAWAASSRSRQHSVATLVDRYGIPQSPVRDLLVEYLTEVKEGMDYGSLTGLAYRLVRLFWAEVLEINPDQADLRLASDVATKWRERLATTLDGRPRREIHSTIFGVRAMYRDISEWSYSEPERWAIWVAPCHIPRSVAKGYSKAKRQRRARMHDRTRMLTPHLGDFRAQALALKTHGQELMESSLAAGHEEQYVVRGVTYQRHDPPIRSTMPKRAVIWARSVHVDDGVPTPPLERGLVNVSRLEADGFWAWAVTETLSETGVRIEELAELTQLSLRHYVAPTTNTVVPLLHIVPSKTDEERLIPMSPDLVKVLLEVQRRVKGEGSSVPLSVRYDPYEKVFSDPLPHLFARRLGGRQEVLSMSYMRKILHQVATATGILDAGQPVTFTPHDFRRLFTTELVGSGLPLHIAATLLGHMDLDTTRGYTAVFPEQVIQAHQSFIERRRATRPDGEMRPATPEEWTDFEQHFLVRKVAVGDCHRPYATPCVHEHACTRCRFLGVSAEHLPRLEDMTANAEARLVEARDRVWLGEVAALEDSLVHLRRRRDEALRSQGSVNLPSRSPGVS